MDGNVEQQRQITSERVRILYAHAPQVLLGGMLAAVILVFILYPHASPELLAAWLLSLILINALRYRLLIRFNRVAGGDFRPLVWAWLFAAGSACSGILWGSGFYLFFQPESLVLILLTLVLAGMIAGSVASLSAFKPAYYAYALCACSPFILRLWLEHGILFQQIAGLTVLFALTNLLYAANAQHVLISAITMRLEKERLAEQLQLQIQATDVARVAAERANLEKSQLLAATSHDLRQPVHAQNLYLDLLKADLAGRPEAEIVQRAIDAGAAVNDLLDSLMEISRIDAGGITPAFSEFPLSAMMQRLRREFMQQAHLKELRLVVVDCAAWCRSDCVLLERILRNLIANAIRYTESGGVVAGVRRRGPNLLIQVWDSGIGVPESQLQSIFEAFKQLGNPERDRRKGLGLGLAIVLRLADLLGHPLRVVSKVGHGSLFEISVPACPAAAVNISEAGQQADLPANCQVLVVEDDPLVLHAAQLTLERWGCQAWCAATAAEALSLADGIADLQIIIADYRLPDGGNGVDLIEQLRRRYGRRVPAAILSGDISPERIEQAYATGFPVLHKPLDAARFRALLSALSREYVTPG